MYVQIEVSLTYFWNFEIFQKGFFEKNFGEYLLPSTLPPFFAGKNEARTRYTRHVLNGEVFTMQLKGWNVFYDAKISKKCWEPFLKVTYSGVQKEWMMGHFLVLLL